ncbi:MAG: ABC transporter ATP-binding protein [Clostridia bacterium]|nr:ABC transporter ATP-binding protein [Clostridia bacterium]
MLKAEKIDYSYGDHEILHGVDLLVEDGEFVSIMGESGSGKSTLLSILAGNLRPASGRVLLGGRDLSAMSERELARLRCTEIGFVYQEFHLIPTLRAAENILLPNYLARGDAKEGKKKMAELAERMSISHVLSSFPEEMSGGECQRVAIARALLYSPSILLMDEPTGNLDSVATEKVMTLLSELNRELSLTMIQVTHSELTAQYGTRIVHFGDGRILSDEVVR